MPKAMLSDSTGDGMSIIPAMRISSPDPCDRDGEQY